MTVKCEWDKLVEEVEKIEGDLPDIGFMIEFAKIWNRVKDYGYLMQSQANEYTERAITAEGKLRKIRSMSERYNNTWSKDMREGTISAKVIEVCDS